MRVGLWEYPRLGFMLRFLALIVKTSQSWWLRICFGVMFLSCSQNLSSWNLSWDDLANACKIQFSGCSRDTTMLQNNWITPWNGTYNYGFNNTPSSCSLSKNLGRLGELVECYGLMQNLKFWSFIARIPTSSWKNLQLLPIFHNK